MSVNQGLGEGRGEKRTGTPTLWNAGPGPLRACHIYKTAQAAAAPSGTEKRTVALGAVLLKYIVNHKNTLLCTCHCINSPVKGSRGSPAWPSGPGTKAVWSSGHAQGTGLRPALPSCGALAGRIGFASAGLRFPQCWSQELWALAQFVCDLVTLEQKAVVDLVGDDAVLLVARVAGNKLPHPPGDCH